MNRTRVILLLAGLIACLAGGALVLLAYWQRQQPVDGPAIAKAVADFCQYQRSHSTALPPSITLSELVQEGFLRPEAIRGFGGVEVRISLRVDDTNPQAIVMEARLPDGSRLNALGDGSVQMPATIAGARTNDAR